jgi:hypothetical protein
LRDLAPGGYLYGASTVGAGGSRDGRDGSSVKAGTEGWFGADAGATEIWDLTAEEKVLAAEFTRLVDGFDARLEEIDAAMSSVMKRLKG